MARRALKVGAYFALASNPEIVNRPTIRAEVRAGVVEDLARAAGWRRRAATVIDPDGIEYFKRQARLYLHFARNRNAALRQHQGRTF